MNWNFGDLLEATYKCVPANRPAIIHGSREISWKEFDARTNRLAHAMRELGLRPGDRIAIMARNIPQYIEIAAASFKARTCHVNINYRYNAEEVKYIVNDSGSRIVFYQSEFEESVLPAAFETSPAIKAVRIGGREDLYEPMLASGSPQTLGIRRSPDDGYLIYTGGTTGKPKGVMWRSADARRAQLESPTVKHPMQNMQEHRDFVLNNESPGRCLSACPLMHGVGINYSLAELVSGGSVVLLESARFDANELWTAVEKFRVTKVLIVGDVFARPMLNALEENPDRWELSSLKVISSAGLTWSFDVKAGLLKHIPHVQLIDILGASEASGFGYSIFSAESQMETGYFTPGKQTVLIDTDTLRVLEHPEPGTGWLARREPFASGYFGDPEKTNQVYRTIGGIKYAIPGDMASRDDQGRIRLLGRSSTCINTGGEKIFVEEVEDVLKAAGGVHDALVVGLPDPNWGQIVVALLQSDPGVSDEDVREHTRKRLASYKVPKQMFFVDEVPRHASGKANYKKALEVASNKFSETKYRAEDAIKQ